MAENDPPPNPLLPARIRSTTPGEAVELATTERRPPPAPRAAPQSALKRPGPVESPVYRPRLRLTTVVLAALTTLLIVIILTPVVAVVLGSFINTQWFGTPPQPGQPRFTLDALRYVAEWYGGHIVFSLELAVLSMILCVIVGVPGGYAFACRPFRGSRALEELVLLPLSLPGIALAIGLIAAYPSLRGNWYFILFGHLLYTLPFMVRTTTTTLRSFRVDQLESAAQSLGARFWQRFRWVVLPNLRHAVVIGSLLVFAISWGEFNVSFLLNSGAHQTYPAALYTVNTGNTPQVAAAATTLFLAVILPVLLAIQWLGGDDFIKVEQGA